MTRASPHDPKVGTGFDDASAEKIGPRAIHRHSSRERVRRIVEPLGKTQTIFRGIRGHRRQHCGSGRRHPLALVCIAATSEDMGECFLFFLLHHQRHRACLSNLRFLGFKRVQAGFDLPRWFVDIRRVVIEE